MFLQRRAAVIWSRPSIDEDAWGIERASERARLFARSAAGATTATHVAEAVWSYALINGLTPDEERGSEHPGPAKQDEEEEARGDVCGRSENAAKHASLISCLSFSRRRKFLWLFGWGGLNNFYKQSLLNFYS